MAHKVRHVPRWLTLQGERGCQVDFLLNGIHCAFCTTRGYVWRAVLRDFWDSCKRSSTLAIAFRIDQEAHTHVLLCPRKPTACWRARAPVFLSYPIYGHEKGVRIRPILFSLPKKKEYFAFKFLFTFIKCKKKSLFKNFYKSFLQFLLFFLWRKD